MAQDERPRFNGTVMKGTTNGSMLQILLSILMALFVVMGGAFGYGVLSERVSTNKDSICEIKDDVKEIKRIVVEMSRNH